MYFPPYSFFAYKYFTRELKSVLRNRFELFNILFVLLEKKIPQIHVGVVALQQFNFSFTPLIELNASIITLVAKNPAASFTAVEVSTVVFEISAGAEVTNFFLVVRKSSNNVITFCTICRIVEDSFRSWAANCHNIND